MRKWRDREGVSGTDRREKYREKRQTVRIEKTLNKRCRLKDRAAASGLRRVEVRDPTTSSRSAGALGHGRSWEKVG